MTTNVATPTRILVSVRFDLSRPDSLSEGCLAALTQARALAAAAGASLHLLHVVEPPVGFPTEWLPTMLDDIHRAATDELGDEIARLAEAGVQATFSIRTGEPWYEILAEAEQQNSDVIVVASRGTAKLEHFVFGSTALRLMRKSRRPVWVVHPEQRDPIRQVLAPVDFGETAQAAISTAELMHTLFGANCWALHCVSYPNDLALARYADGAERVREYHRQVNADAEQRMRNLIGSDAPHWQVQLGHAALTEEVEGMIRAHGVDLVVLGSISRTGLRGLLTGNTAEKIFSRVDCSLWVLKPASWVSPVSFE